MTKLAVIKETMTSLPTTLAVGLLAVLTMALCSSCSAPSNDYAEYINLPQEGWKYGDTLRFTPVHPDSICRGRLVVGIRHENDFPYTSLWLETTLEDGGKRRVDTLEIPLADDFGSWTGRGIGASFQATDTLPGSFLHRSGAKVKIRQIMRCDTLTGISQVGIFFVPTK
jgi:gliding motility-associated lipoprotein GldH